MGPRFGTTEQGGAQRAVLRGEDKEHQASGLDQVRGNDQAQLLC